MIRINLLPVRAAKKKESLRFQLTVAGLITFFVVALVTIVYIAVNSEVADLRSEIQRSEEELKALKARIGELAKIKEQKKVVEEKLAIIKELDAARSGPVDLLVKISNAIPRRAWLNQLKDEGRQIILKGAALSDDVVADFMRGLERYADLGRVELEVARRAKDAETGRDVVNFTIRLEKKG